MKEKIIKILKSHSYHHTVGVGVKSQFKYLAEVAFECCADEIMLALDQSKFTADEADEHINQEVEKRIAERMPVLIKYWSRRRVVDDPDLEELLRLDDLFKSIYQANRRIDFGMAADMGMECVIKEIFRSRLVSQKTEGGGE